MKKIILGLMFLPFFISGMEPNADPKAREEELIRKVKEGKIETMSEFVEIVKFLEKDERFPSKTLLHHAAGFRAYKIAEQLINQGFDVNAIDYKNKTTPLFEASTVEMAELLFKHHVRLDVTNGFGDSLLHGEPACYLPEMTEWFIEHGISVDRVNNMKQTPLHQARRKKVAELLINHGADVNARDKYEDTPLDEAVLNGKADIVELLISRGAKIKIDEDCTSTPVHIAAANGDKDVLEVFIRAGVDLNCVNLVGETPLHWAARNNNREMVDFLIQKGANPEV